MLSRLPNLAIHPPIGGSSSHSFAAVEHHFRSSPPHCCLGIATTVGKSLRNAKISPAPRRGGPSWSEFLSAQARGILACEFFTVESAIPVIGKRPRAASPLRHLPVLARSLNYLRCVGARRAVASTVQSAPNTAEVFSQRRERLLMVKVGLVCGAPLIKVSNCELMASSRPRLSAKVVGTSAPG